MSDITLKAAVFNYLTTDQLFHLRDQVGLSDAHLTPNTYQAYLQVFSWAVIAHLKKSSPSLTKNELTEREVSPLVNQVLRPTCKVLPKDSGYPDLTPPALLSRVIWYTQGMDRHFS